MTTPRAHRRAVEASQVQSDAPAGEPRRLYLILKRGQDILLSSLALVLLAPLLLVIAIAIKLDSPGPVIFRQERIGKDGRRFQILKLRSMTANADDSLHRESVRRTALGIRTSLSDGRQVFKPPEDPRVTRVGGVIRSWCLDELPQLVNVLRGEMSLVGPRPALEYELPYYQSWHFARFDVLPGITGIWQVTRTSEVSFDDMMHMDIEYAGRATIASDVLLILQTIPAIIRDRGVF